MDKKIIIIDNENKKFILRSIDDKDLENMRRWKNENRDVFFYQKIITAKQQKVWFLNYLKDPFDYMFIIEYETLQIGCIGFKLNNKIADIYNVILGNNEYKRKGLMSFSIKMLINYITCSHTKKVTVKVLKSNATGQRFYEKNGFNISQEMDNYVLWELR